MIIIACIVKTVKKLWVSSYFFAKFQTILGDFMLHFKKYGDFTKIHLCIPGSLMCFQISHGHQWSIFMSSFDIVCYFNFVVYSAWQYVCDLISLDILCKSFSFEAFEIV